MPEQKIHVIGNDEIVLLLGLLGIDGTILESSEQFMSIFGQLINNPSIGMILIGFDLNEEITNFLIDFKLNNRMPLVYLLPDVFKTDIEDEDIFLNIIRNSVGKIIY
jgi:vacuolar-type H+-ATPase subunit F/Vma7